MGKWWNVSDAREHTQESESKIGTQQKVGLQSMLLLLHVVTRR